MKRCSRAYDRQSGLSLFGFIFVIVICAFVAILGMKVVPTVTEYSTIKKAIVTARDAGTSARDIQAAFDRQKNAGYIESVSGNDLTITRNDSGFDVGVAYEKKIELFGPVSLVINYVASTGKASVKKAD